MVTADESKRALRLLTSESVDTAVEALVRVSGSPTARRAALLNSVPEIIGYFSEGSAALAVDFYEEERERAGVRDRSFVTSLVVDDRTVKIRRGVAWAADPLFSDEEEVAAARLAEIVQLETARPYRDTILANRRADPQAVGWRRNASGSACAFCRMLADRGAVYRQATVRFAAHPNCYCTAQPVFRDNDPGTEVGVIQYVASRRSKTPAQRAQLRAYLSAVYSD